MQGPLDWKRYPYVPDWGPPAGAWCPRCSTSIRPRACA